MKGVSTTIIFEKAGAELNSLALKKFVDSACKAARLRAKPSVLIARNSRIRNLNSRFRGKDYATDVLSFPAAESNGFAGDIAVSFDIAARNARALGHSVADEIRILILHGILHLAGYDHEKDRGEMERKETALRSKFGLPTTLIERSLKPKTSLVVGRRRSAKPRTSGESSKRTTNSDAPRSRT